MEGGGSCGGDGGEDVVKMEEAVVELVEHLVRPVLPLGSLLRRPEDLASEGEDTVARQVHAAVLLYNYFHRKQFPQLELASPERFCECASTSIGASLLGAYLTRCRGTAINDEDEDDEDEDDDDDDDDDDEEIEPSVTYKAVIDACTIAEALDATADAPDMTTWPISKVAVLLIDGTRTRCLIECGAVTMGVWSILEKELGEDSPVRRSKRNASACQDSEPYVLQQTAYSEVERKTGLKRSDLRVLEEHLVYSLSKKETSTKLFVLQYDQIMNTSKLHEMPLNNLIYRMTGPILKNNPDPTTTCVVNYYHILPYEKVLLDLLNRELSPEYPSSAPKEKPRGNRKLTEQEVNCKPKLQRTTTTISALRKNKQVVKERGNSGTNNCSTKQTRRKRKDEVVKATATTPVTYAEDQGGKRPRKQNDSPDLPIEQKLKSVCNPMNAKAKGASAEIVDLAGVQIDKSGTKKHSVSRNMTQNISLVKALEVDTVVGKHASESQNEKVTEKSSLQKMRDNTVREHRMLADRSAQLDMDIQTILSEGRVTPKVMSIIKRREDIANSTCSGEGCQTIISTQTKGLKEAILRNKCQELDDICHDNNWIPPTYQVLPSVTIDKYKASVYLSGPDFNLSADGGMRTNPHEARDSAASNMIHQIQQKANEN
ncbi:hypothetical protein ACP4OV_006933 [Aristida adscensionis]